jgi:hypothetical protein
VAASPSPSTSILYGEVDFIIKNQVDDIVLVRGIFYISKGKRDGKFSTKILPMSEAFLKAKASLSSTGTIRCCLVYELVNQRDEIAPIMKNYRVFIAVIVFARSITNSYMASVVMFMAEQDKFTGRKDDIERLRKISREHLVNNTYSFECAIGARMLRLEIVFHPGKQSSIEVTLKKTINYTDKRPVLFE